MRLMLDTSAYSAFMRNHPQVVPYLQGAMIIAVSPIVLGELHSGFLGGVHRLRNEHELRDFLNSPRVIVPALDGETALTYVEIHRSLKRAGTPIPTNDIWIAATAMQHGFRVLTMDTHFLRIPQIMVELCEPS